MKNTVLKTFAGTPCSGKKGTEIEIKNDKVAADLIRAGYIKAAGKGAKKTEDEDKWFND